MTGVFRFFSERKDSTNTEIEVTERFCGEKLTGIPGHQLFRSTLIDVIDVRVSV